MTDPNEANKKRQKIISMVVFGLLAALFVVGLLFTRQGKGPQQATTSVPFAHVGDQNDKNAWRAQSEAQFAEMKKQLDAANGKADEATEKLKKVVQAQEDLKKQFDDQKKAGSGSAASAPAAASSTALDRALLNKPIPLNGQQAKSGAILNPPFGQNARGAAMDVVAPPAKLDIINFDSPKKAGDDCVDPRFSSLPIDQAKQAQQDCLKANGKKGVTFIPATAFVRVFMMNGVDAPTGGEAQHDPLHVFLEVLDLANLPNARKLDITGCRILTSAYGDVSSERTMMHGETLACILKNGRTVEMTIKGTVMGEDGKEGVRGRLVSKSGSALAMSVLAGISSGIGQAFSQSANTLNTTALGTTSIVNPSQVGRSAIGSGVSQGADSLKQYYIRAAEKLFPVIETDGGRVVEFAVMKGAEYNGALSDVSDINDGLANGGRETDGGYSDE
ncbi:TrbI/VirB10 family protein [Burkholderia glumae]|uniref:TrbI/VirB10 family protein n=1 Tax=Burkholderia glumae TaxID=337 RepID=UPI0001A4B825|nr:TrbI/VirB10 family protein [Burkholderia glumae]ACR32920.1 conjugal transfer protein traB [Burkholderia glumae BGR1]NVE26320.1 conjugal transfer protein TraB [Burkholderia glumae]UVS88674.1 conjugal transfer protein TraB [Burkholderia glumae]UVT00197.1 conjugal transfer protein TraB [Burkholderia glumae]